MKIKCSFCDNLIDDSNAVCPYCGAPNEGVVRKSGDQPVTIEELKAWYKSKGLPSYETTRFFIGENYKKPRAFGIYQDGKNFIVYKNKDNGERAVRYKGTDEAYAVNELFQRLKQEIIQQKGAAQKKAAARNSNYQPSPAPKKKRKIGCFGGCLLSIVGFFGIIFLAAVIWVIIQDYPNRGYYNWQDSTYYYYVNPATTEDHGWYCYEDSAGGWGDELDRDSTPEALRKNRRAKNYFVSTDWNSSLGVTDFTKTDLYAGRILAYEDKQNHYNVDQGYYQHSGRTYYHLKDSYDSGWYLYDTSLNDWTDVDYSAVPEDLLHESLADDFFYTPVWDSSTQISDFTDTKAYADEQAAIEASRSSSRSSNSSSSSSSWDDDDDYDYSWSSSDSWDSSSSDWDSDW